MAINDSRLGYGSMTDRLKQVTSLSDSAPTPMAKFPDYLSQYRKKYAKNMMGINPSMFNGSGQLSLSGLNASAGLGAGIGAGQGGWGSARASSYWDAQTAEGRPMSATTIASPYLPIGTIVQIRKGNKIVTGRVGDFGPADWVMRGDPNRFLDLATPMMRKLTGQGNNLTGVSYKVLKYGSGRVYRPNSSMTKQLRKMWGM